MARKDPRDPQQRIRELESELADKDRELMSFRKELATINGELEKFIGQIGQELKLAALIQKTLVPTEIPTIPGFDFSTKFIASSLKGGDYFDIFELEDKMRFGTVLASSTGHGMAALFMSVLLKLTTQIEAKKGMEPSEVLKHMTHEVQTKIKTEDQAHVFYALVDRRRYTLTYSCAGTVPAFIYKYAEDKLVTLDSTSGPIGKESTGKFKEEMISLDPRDKFILASQGVIQAVDEEHKPFGQDRLLEYLVEHATSDPHTLRNEILFQVEKYSEGRDYPRDLSVIVMEVKDKVIKLRKG